MLSHFSRVQLFMILGTVVFQAPLSMGFSRQENWSGLPCPPPGNLPDPGIESISLTSPALAGGFFITSTTWITNWAIREVWIYYAAAKSLQSCPTLCDPVDSSPPGSPVPGILQARTLEWVAISFSNAGKWKVKVKSLIHVRLVATHGLQPTRLLRPWDFPGKSTGVGCHYLLQVSVYVSFKSKLQCFLSISLRFLQTNPNSLSFEHMWHLACVKLG